MLLLNIVMSIASILCFAAAAHQWIAINKSYPKDARVKEATVALIASGVFVFLGIVIVVSGIVTT